MALVVSSSIVPENNSPEDASSGTCPEQNTSPSDLIACDNGPTPPGTFSVVMTSLAIGPSVRAFFAKKRRLYRRYFAKNELGSGNSGGRCRRPVEVASPWEVAELSAIAGERS